MGCGYTRPLRSRRGPRPSPPPWVPGVPGTTILPSRLPVGTGFPRHDEVFVLMASFFVSPTTSIVSPGTPGAHGGVRGVRGYTRPLRSRRGTRPTPPPWLPGFPGTTILPSRLPVGTGFPRHDEVFVLTASFFVLMASFFVSPTTSIVSPGTPGAHGGVRGVRGYTRPLRRRRGTRPTPPPCVPGVPGTTILPPRAPP